MNKRLSMRKTLVLILAALALFFAANHVLGQQQAVKPLRYQIEFLCSDEDEVIIHVDQ